MSAFLRWSFRALFLLLPVLVVLYFMGSQAIAPARGPVGPPPQDLNAESLAFRDRDGLDVAAWAIDGSAEAPVIVLAHGIRSDRRSLVSRARFLSEQGYSVLMIDLRAHGESAGDQLSFGYYEARSVAAALDYARQRWPGRKTGVIGLSLGGAAAIVAAGDKPADAYVLEAVFSTLLAATENRFVIRSGEFGKYIARALLLQVPLRLGFSVDELSMVERIGSISSPVMIIAGNADKKTTMADTNQLFAAARQPKELWVIDGAAHIDFHAAEQQAYEQRVSDFLKRHLSD